MKVFEDIKKLIEQHPERVVRLFRSQQVDAPANYRNVSNALKIFGQPFLVKLLQAYNPQSNFTDYSNATGDSKPTLQRVIDGLARLSLGASNTMRYHRGQYPMIPAYGRRPYGYGAYPPVMSNGTYYDLGAYDPAVYGGQYNQAEYDPGVVAESPLPRPNNKMLWVALGIAALLLYLQFKK